MQAETGTTNSSAGEYKEYLGKKRKGEFQNALGSATGGPKEGLRSRKGKQGRVALTRQVLTSIAWGCKKGRGGDYFPAG